MTNLHEITKKLDTNGKAFINGKYVSASQQAVFNRKSPIDGQFVISMAACSEKDIDNAVMAARVSFKDGRWAKMNPSQRKGILLKFAELIQKHAKQLAVLDTLSMGKPISDCLNNDIPLAVNCLKWYAESIDKMYDECVPPLPDALGIVTREPLGVVGAITPWNYPMENVAWKIAPALAAGNSLVLKPAEQSSLSAVYLGKLATEAGIPAGVFTVVPGVGEVAGKALAMHKDVDGIFFTGSSEVGKKMMQYSGLSNIKRVALECGGKSAFIVLKDYSDLSEAAEVLAKNIFSNQGQTCTAPSRLIVEEDIHDEMIDKLLNLVPEYCPANPFDEKTTQGAMVSHEHLERVLEYVEIGKKEGATLLTGGKKVFPIEGGAYMTPTIFDNVKNNMRIAQEEIFGPVLSVISVKDEHEAVKVANESNYGLAAAVWTEDINKAHRMAKNLQAGLIHINSYGEDNITAPFGGYKQSGNGSKDKSLHALDDYTELKTVWLKIH